MKVESCQRLWKIPGSNILLPLIWLNSKFDFQVANLLLATPNFEPCNFDVWVHCHFNPLPDDKISDWSKLKQLADDILKSQ